MKDSNANFVSPWPRRYSNAGPIGFHALREDLRSSSLMLAMHRVHIKHWSMVPVSERLLAFYMIEYHEERVIPKGLL